MKNIHIYEYNNYEQVLTSLLFLCAKKIKLETETDIEIEIEIMLKLIIYLINDVSSRASYCHCVLLQTWRNRWT